MHKVGFHPLAHADLFGLYDYIHDQSGPTRAAGYIDRIEDLCLKLSEFPDRGTNRSDLGPGIRTIALERRVLVVYRTGDAAVEILRVLYAGRDFTKDDLPEEQPQ